MSIPHSVYSAMQTGSPYRTYKKAILGKVAVVLWNPFSEKPEERIIRGNPFVNNENLESCLIDVWTEKEAVFFENVNANHLKNGNIIPFDRSKFKVEPTKSWNNLPDEELEKILNGRYFTITNALDKMTTEAPVARMLELARQLEKSEKIISTVEERLAEIQAGVNVEV